MKFHTQDVPFLLGCRMQHHLFTSYPLNASILTLVVLLGTLPSWAQETDEDPLTLPETIVEGEQESDPDEEPIAPPQIPSPVDFQPPSIIPPPNQTTPGSLLEGTVFSSPAVEGYYAESSTTGTLLDIPDLELPMTVDVVSEEVIEDQQILNFTETLRNVPGVVQAGDGIFGDRFFIRGLEVRSRDFRKNGFLDPTYTPRDFANIERVEILKGPASVLYGSAAPSGTVNVITKKPLDAEFTDFNFQFGSFGQDRYVLDNNGYVTSDGKVLYRFIGAYENTGSFRDFASTERFLLAPSIRWLVSPDTMITWEVEIARNDRLGDTGIPAINGDPLALPIERYVGEPANDFLHTEDYRTSVVLNHRFNEDWSLYAGASTVFYEFPGSQTYPVAQVGPTQFFRLRQDFQDQENSSSLIVNLTGDLCLGGLKHKVLFGTEQVYYDTESFFGGNNLDFFDAANPVYNNPPVGPVAFSTNYPVFRQVRHGYYFQDLVELNKHWQVLGGVRFDEVDLTYDRNMIRTEQRFERTTPRVGVVFQPIPDTLMTYFSYSRSFNPPGGGGFGPTNDPRLAELGESYEVGIKTRFLDYLILHAAGYHITRENVPYQQQVLPFGFFQTGTERSQGAEIELVGKISERWDLIANYAYTDTRLTDASNPDIFFGQRQRNVPYNQSSIWSRYDLVDNGCQTIGAALGYVYVGDRTADVPGTVILDSYTRWDAGMYYRQGPIDAALYLENIFDIRYAASSINEFQIYPGAPFSARAQIGVRF
ncbi:TonB-dependent siderophore receptor [Planctomycetales bacterium 10988]|nr:TonB-dependent siderophore receptor [Planctomycetales bacterium 10988]